METRQVILQLRTAKGLSQEELAAKVYVTRQAVSRWETGLSVPDAGMLVRIAGAQLLSGAPVIGGADRATGIWVVRPSGPWLPLLLTAGAGLAAVAGLWKTRKK